MVNDEEIWLYKEIKPVWWAGKEVYIPDTDIIIPIEEIKHFCEKYGVCIPEKEITLDELERRAEENPKGIYAKFLRLLFFQQRMKTPEEFKKYARWFIRKLPRKYRERYDEETLVASIASAIQRNYFECRSHTGVWCGMD